MIFLMTGLFAGAILGGIPILVHLLHRQKTTPIAWGAMQFLLETPLKMRRRKWIDHWSLMLVRIGLILLMVALLARPQVQGGPAQGTVPMDVGVVLDHSLSTGRRNGDQTLFDQSVAMLEKIRDMLPPTATLSVVLAEHHPRPITPLPVRGRGEIDKVLQVLRQTRPGQTDGSIPEAVQLARELVNKGRNAQKAILVLSDEQRSNWFIENPGAWKLALGDRTSGPDKDLSVYTLGIPATSPVPNLSVGAIGVQPGMLGINRRAQVIATIANAGPGDMPNVPVQLLVDGKPAGTTRIANLPAGQSQTIPFDVTFTEPGHHWVRVRTEVVDALEADNAATAAVHVIPRLPVLIVDGQLTNVGAFRSSQFLVAAMQPVDVALEATTLIRPKVVSVADAASVTLADYPIVVLNDVPQLPPEFVARLADHIQRGNGLWIILGPRTEPLFLNNTLAKTPLFPAQAKGRLVQTKDAPGIDIKAPEHPTVALLTQAERNAFAGTVLNLWWQVAPGGEQTAILGTTTGDPLALEHTVGGNGGRAILWTTPADGSGGTLPYMASFVPLVHETLYHLASGQAQNRNLQLEAGGRIVWTGPAQPPTTAVRVTRPDGLVQDNLTPRLTVDGKYSFTYDETFIPGLYELRFTPPSIPQPVYYSVNIERRELDPAVLSSADLEALRSDKYLKERLTGETLARAFHAEVGGTDVWRYAALGLLALFVFETYLTFRAVRLGQSMDVANAGLVGPHRA